MDSVPSCWHAKHLISVVWADRRMMMFCSMHKHSRGRIRNWKKGTFLSLMHGRGAVSFVLWNLFYLFLGETYFEKEIISKTRIVILSHSLDNRKNKTLNPKVKWKIRLPQRNRVMGMKIFFTLTWIFAANCYMYSAYDTWLAAQISTGGPGCHWMCHTWQKQKKNPAIVTKQLLEYT